MIFPLAKKEYILAFGGDLHYIVELTGCRGILLVSDLQFLSWNKKFHWKWWAVPLNHRNNCFYWAFDFLKKYCQYFEYVCPHICVSSQLFLVYFSWPLRCCRFHHTHSAVKLTILKGVIRRAYVPSTGPSSPVSCITQWPSCCNSNAPTLKIPSVSKVLLDWRSSCPPAD